MSYEALSKSVKLSEGVRNKIYQDTEGFDTIGWGHKVVPADNFVAGKVAWEQSAVDQMKGSWKDEVALIVLLLPAVLVFTPLQDHVHKGFLALQDLPSYYHNLLYIAISASFGIKAGSSAIGMFKKK